MAKINETNRIELQEAIKPYKTRIQEILEKEKTVLNAIRSGCDDIPGEKIMLCEDMIYVYSLYMAQNELSLKILEVKNNDALNEARKVLYRAIIYLEDLVSNFIDVSYSELAEKYEAISHISLEKRYYISRKLGLAINLLEEAFGENSKWKWSFVELKGRFAVVAKNLLDMRTHAKDYFDPNSPLYETAVQYVRMVNQLLESSASGYRDKYELSTRRLDDMRNAIKFLLARHKIAMAIGDKTYAEEVKKKALVWRDKMDADTKAGSSH